MIPLLICIKLSSFMMLLVLVMMVMMVMMVTTIMIVTVMMIPMMKNNGYSFINRIINSVGGSYGHSSRGLHGGRHKFFIVIMPILIRFYPRVPVPVKEIATETATATLHPLPVQQQENKKILRPNQCEMDTSSLNSLIQMK